jgi:hypothetical protein
LVGDIASVIDHRHVECLGSESAKVVPDLLPLSEAIPP